MKQILKLSFRTCLAVFILLVAACNNNQPADIKNDANDSIVENVTIEVETDTSDYFTSIIENNNPEGHHVIVVQYRVSLTNEDSENSIRLTDIVIIENPQENTAKYSIEYEDSQDGLYNENNEKLEIPFVIEPGEKFSCILKHGKKISHGILEFLKDESNDMTSLSHKQILEALKNKGLQLIDGNNESEQLFQLILYSENQNKFEKKIKLLNNN